MSDIDGLVDTWLAGVALWWERAHTSNPPDFDVLEDFPGLPGDVSARAFIEAIRARMRSPGWVEVNLPYRYSSSSGTKAGTLEAIGLTRPGVEVEMADGKRYLIGDVNTTGGVCDDCVAFEPDAVVTRCRVLVPPKG